MHGAQTCMQASTQNKNILKHISKSRESLGCSIEDVQMANKHVETRLPPLHSACHEDN